MPKPNILDPKFRYVPAAATDIRKTFARVRREQAAERAAQAQQAKPKPVVHLARRAAK